MTTVYLVIERQGYEDFTVLAAFTTRELAETFATRTDEAHPRKRSRRGYHQYLVIVESVEVSDSLPQGYKP